MASNETLTHTPGRSLGDRLYLLVLRGDSSSILNLPRDGQVIVGRAPDVELHIEAREASRRHAELAVRGGEATVVDLDSHNGTLLNGERITGPHALASGDVISIGEVVLVFHSVRAPRRQWLDLRALRLRLGDEIERATHFGRPLSVVAVDFRDRPVDAAALSLRAVDFAAVVGHSKLIAVFPERGAESVPTVAGADLTVATYPEDGLDAESLLAAAGPGADDDRAGARRAQDPAGRSGDAASLRAGEAAGPQRAAGADHRRDGRRQGERGLGNPSQGSSARARASCPSTARPCPRTSSRASCSVMKRVPSPVRSRPSRGCSS